MAVTRHHIDSLEIEVQRKAITRLRLSVRADKVVLGIPWDCDLSYALAFATQKRDWIRKQQARLKKVPPCLPKQFVSEECHWIWGDPYALVVQEQAGKPSVTLTGSHLILRVRPGSQYHERAAVMETWQKSLLHGVIPERILHWQGQLGVHVRRYTLQRMKTRWGSCQPRTGSIRLNTQLVEKPRELLDYVIVHEIAHFLVANHGPDFALILDRHYPTWREAQTRLNPTQRTRLLS